MFYFSNLFNKKIRDKNDEIVGHLVDIAVDSDDKKQYPPVVGILVKGKNNKEYYVEIKNVSNWSSGGIFLRCVLNEKMLSIPKEDHLLFLNRHIVDKQIVDLSGVKVVRVNDLQFSIVQGIMSLLAIDVSTSGLLRRLGFHGSLFRFFKPHLLEWKDIHIVGDKLQFDINKDDLVKLHPADIANIVEKLNLNQSSTLLDSLDERTAAKVLEEVQPEIQKILVQHLGPERAMDIVGKMSADELVDLIQLLPARESVQLIERLPSYKDAKSLRKILEYDEDEAGGLMTTEYLTASSEDTVGETIEKIKKYSHLHRSIFFVYVVDTENHYLGVVSMRRLMISDEKRKVGEVMKRIAGIPGVKVDANLTKIATIMTKYNLLSVAVIDNDNHLLGIVTIDDIMRCLIPNA
ncbi:MAG TPA: hypothetical protein DEB09_03620 [Candidatus Magasanikbacteria bacterium]|nr:hypothetical protein [Candidatus Magasanikbacteria bacterium]